MRICAKKRNLTGSKDRKYTVPASRPTESQLKELRYYKAHHVQAMSCDAVSDDATCDDSITNTQSTKRVAQTKQKTCDAVSDDAACCDSITNAQSTNQVTQTKNKQKPTSQQIRNIIAKYPWPKRLQMIKDRTVNENQAQEWLTVYKCKLEQEGDAQLLNGMNTLIDMHDNNTMNLNKNEMHELNQFIFTFDDDKFRGNFETIVILIKNYMNAKTKKKKNEHRQSMLNIIAC